MALTPLPDNNLDSFPLTYARRVLLASLVTIGMGQTVLFAVLAPLGREIGLLEVQVGAIISLSSLTVFLAAPIWGRTSDRWGRKKVMLVGLFGYSIGTVLFAGVFQSALWGVIGGTTAFVALIVSRIMHAIVMAATMPASSAYMADITTVATRTKGMGQVGAANNVGAILGPAMGGGLAMISLLTPLYCAAVLTLITGFLVWRYLPRSPGRIAQVKPPRMRYTDRRIAPFVGIGVLMFMGFAIVQQTMAFRMQDALGLTATETARMFGAGMMLSAASSLVAQIVIVQRMELAPFTLLRLAIPILIVTFAVMASVASAPWLLFSMTLLGFGMGLAGPGFMSGASLAVTPEEQGAVAGIAGSCPPLGFTIGPIAGTAMYQIKPELPYLFALCVYIVLFLAMAWLSRRARRKNA